MFLLECAQPEWARRLSSALEKGAHEAGSKWHRAALTWPAASRGAPSALVEPSLIGLACWQRGLARRRLASSNRVQLCAAAVAELAGRSNLFVSRASAHCCCWQRSISLSNGHGGGRLSGAGRAGRRRRPARCTSGPARFASAPRIVRANDQSLEGNRCVPAALAN